MQKEDLPVYRWRAFLGPWVLIVLAWGIILLAFSTGHACLLDHDFLLKTSHLPWWIALVIFLGMWQLMIAAMMLPSTLSTLIKLSALDDMSGSYWMRQGCFIASYAAVWTGFAIAIFFGDMLIHFSVDHWEWLSLHSRWIGTILCIIAGIYQWSAKKRSYRRYCTNEGRGCCSSDHLCCSPWQEGWNYGRSCLGSCWAVMLVMFGIAMNNLLLMILLTWVMVIEKEAQAGERCQFLIGAAFLLLGTLWILFPAI